jgi:hypothetical protein
MNPDSRNRPLCKDLDCDVEVSPEQKYCAAHSWFVKKWLEKSKAMLERLRNEAQKEPPMKTEQSTCRLCHRNVLVARIYDSQDKILKTVELDPEVPVYIVCDRGDGGLIAKKSESAMPVHACDEIQEFTDKCRKRQEDYDRKHPNIKRYGQKAA